MAFNKAAYVATLKAKLLEIVGEEDDAEGKLAQAYGDALEAGFSELTMQGATAIATGVTTGAATVPVTSQPGDIT